MRSFKYVSIYLFFFLCVAGFEAAGQTNTVQFGKNRLQFKQFHWEFFQTEHFNTYFSQNGQQIGKSVAQMAEEELESLEDDMDYSFRERLNIIVYNSYQDFKQSNVGIGLDWQNTGGVTKLVGDKLLVYFDSDINRLRVQIREGIAKVILNNLMFGTSVGEFAGNSVLLNLPEWFTDGYVAYTAESWNTELDNQLKQLIRGGKYNNFQQLVLDHPTLAGHAFMYYLSDVYGVDMPSYLVYISRINRSMKKAFSEVLQKKYKQVISDFYIYTLRRYQQDNRGRRQLTRGTVAASKTDFRSDNYRIHPNPKPRSTTYAMVQFKSGLYQVQLFQGFVKPKVLLQSGVRMRKSEVNPDYPLLGWDPTGNQLAVIYPKRGKLDLMIYDLVSRTKNTYQLPEEYQSVQSFQYLPTRKNTLLLSAVKNSQSDLFTFDISNFKSTQLTNDVFDDTDPSYVGFAKKSGIIFSSNRPYPEPQSGDTVTRHLHNIFLLGNWEDPASSYITQLTNLETGNASKPMQYDPDNFTFVGDQNGIFNRYVGSLASKNEGIDTIFYVGGNRYRNPPKEILDSALMLNQLTRPDSIKLTAITSDSTYTFPITNYADGITESYTAGQRQEISETVKRGNFVRSFKLKVDQQALNRRNVSTPLTTFKNFQLSEKRKKSGGAYYFQQPENNNEESEKVDSSDFFQSEFGYEAPDSNAMVLENLESQRQIAKKTFLKNIVPHPYHLRFSTDYLIAQLDNSVLIDRYQPFMNGGGPIYLQQPFNGLIQVGVSDLFEDIKFTGGFRFPSNFNGSEYYFAYNNLRHYLDYELLYYHKVDRLGLSDLQGNPVANGKLKTNLYQVKFNFPIDEARSVRLTLGYRNDITTLLAGSPETLTVKDSIQKYLVSRLEYVYDNTINPTTNIWNGLRWKAYMEVFPQLNMAKGQKERNMTFNAGVDARYYLPIYKNFIWATRFAADFSWGNRKVMYYLGGVDNWLAPKFNNNNPVSQQEMVSAQYAYQTLTENLRGYTQNVKHGNNAMVLNTELRLPVFATFIEQPIGSDFVRNFQVISFMDMGSAWHGGLSDLKNNTPSYTNSLGNVIVDITKNKLGPFVGGYGFGARTKIAGYFLRVDTAWPMERAFFNGKPRWYFALGVDF